MKKLSAKAIYQNLVQTLGAEAVADLAVPWYLPVAKLPSQCNKRPDEAGATRPDSVEAGILKAFADNLFSSVRELLRLTCLS
jgi:hypothetical protein